MTPSRKPVRKTQHGEQRGRELRLSVGPAFLQGDEGCCHQAHRGEQPFLARLEGTARAEPGGNLPVSSRTMAPWLAAQNIWPRRTGSPSITPSASRSRM